MPHYLTSLLGLVVAFCVQRLLRRAAGRSVLRRLRAGKWVTIGTELFRADSRLVLWGTLVRDGADWVWVPRVPFVRGRRWLPAMVAVDAIPIDEEWTGRSREHSLTTGDRLRISRWQAAALPLFRAPGSPASARFLAAQSRLLWGGWAVTMAIRLAFWPPYSESTILDLARFAVNATALVLGIGVLTWLTGRREFDQRRAKAVPEPEAGLGEWQRKAVRRMGATRSPEPGRVTRWSRFGFALNTAFGISQFLTTLCFALALAGPGFLAASAWDAWQFGKGPTRQVQAIVQEDSSWIDLPRLTRTTSVKVVGEGSSSFGLNTLRKLHAGERVVLERAGDNIRLPGDAGQFMLSTEGYVGLAGLVWVFLVLRRRTRRVLALYELPHQSRPYAAFRRPDTMLLVVLLDDTGEPEVAFAIQEQIRPAGTMGRPAGPRRRRLARADPGRTTAHSDGQGRRSRGRGGQHAGRRSGRSVVSASAQTRAFCSRNLATPRQCAPCVPAYIDPQGSRRWRWAVSRRSYIAHARRGRTSASSARSAASAR